MMEERRNVSLITDEMICRYGNYLRKERRSRATVEKYLRDVRKLQKYLCLLRGGESGGKEAGKYGFNKKVVLGYKRCLNEHHRTTSISSMLTAVNSFLEYLGYGEYKVELPKIRHVQLSEPERKLTGEDYRQLVQATGRKKDTRTSMLFQTVGSTGIRISELRFITVESLGHDRVDIYNKGKSRIILLPTELVRVLIKYCREVGIIGGNIFITRSGKPMDRSNISKEVEEVSWEAGVGEKRIFPHNFHHLFTGTFYRIKKDVVRLTDLLGHSNINTTRIYAMDTGEQPRRQMSRVRLVLG